MIPEHFKDFIDKLTEQTSQGLIKWEYDKREKALLVSKPPFEVKLKYCDEYYPLYQLSVYRVLQYNYVCKIPIITNCSDFEKMAKLYNAALSCSGMSAEIAKELEEFFK